MSTNIYNREISYGSDCREIPLTQGKFALVDAEDHDYLMQWKWCARRGKCGNYYALKGIKTGINKRGIVFMHRAIMQVENGKYIDHINGDGLDNRKCNLRICSNAENSRNRIKTTTASSQYKGVTWNKKTKKWLAQITTDYKNFYLGQFSSEENAAYAYNIAAKKYHGEFAWLNDVGAHHG